MAQFLLIHGAGHGAWCWHKVVPRLTALGHSAKAIDLPGSGDDATPRDTVRMRDYVERVRAAMDTNTILVGHSFGGYPITLAASSGPTIPRALVYLCALVPQTGTSFSENRKDMISQDVSKAQTADREAGVTRIIRAKAGPVFYSDCAPEDRDFALDHVTPQPIGPMTETLEFEPTSCPRAYIRCLEDNVVMPAYQKRVSDDWHHVYDMQAGHSPFLSQPAELARILDDIGKTV